MSEKKIDTRKTTLLSLMVGYSLILYIIEGFIPNPMIAVFPGAKLGLSNIITLVALMTFGLKDTFIILTVRIILSTIFTGPISYLMFSIGGGYLSLIAMYLCSNIKGFSMKLLSPPHSLVSYSLFDFPELHKNTPPEYIK